MNVYRQTDRQKQVEGKGEENIWAWCHTKIKTEDYFHLCIPPPPPPSFLSSTARLPSLTTLAKFLLIDRLMSTNVSIERVRKFACLLVGHEATSSL